MINLLLLLLKGNEKIKVEIDLELKYLEEKDYDLKELVLFLESVKNIHEQIVISSQSEYKTLGKKYILPYNRIKVSKINKNSPLFIKLSFELSSDGVFPYIIILRYLIKLCKKYGADANMLKLTFNNIEEALVHYIQNISKDILNEQEKDKLITKIHENVFSTSISEIFENKKFIRNYNIFCRTSLEISKLVLRIDKLINFIDPIIEE
jgi:hypothetical protein